jgi:hypothetical protein
VEFLASVLGPEGQPGSAPWPKPNELKPLTLLLYMAREYCFCSKTLLYGFYGCVPNEVTPLTLLLFLARE